MGVEGMQSVLLLKDDVEGRIMKRGGEKKVVMVMRGGDDDDNDIVDVVEVMVTTLVDAVVEVTRSRCSRSNDGNVDNVQQ